MLLRNVLAAQLLPVRCGGHGLPAVLIDAENQCDVWLLAKVLQAWMEWVDSIRWTFMIFNGFHMTLKFLP